jgi:hypothetical protein
MIKCQPDSVDSNGEESLSEDNADDESDAENGSDIEVPVVSGDEVDDNDLTVTASPGYTNNRNNPD